MNANHVHHRRRSRLWHRRLAGVLSQARGLCHSMFARHVCLTSVIAMLAASVGQPAWGQRVTSSRVEARTLALQKGWTIRRTTPQRTIELHRVVRGIPLYYTTTNLDAADTLSTDECWPGGSSGLDLTGAGVRLGMWDAGATYAAHVDLADRVAQMDSPYLIDEHATHVAGIMIAAGFSPAYKTYPKGQSKGMSPAAMLESYDWGNDDIEMSAAAAAGMLVSNHSYGIVGGWEYTDFGAGWAWYWLGDVSVSTTEDYFFGFYSFQSAIWDEVAYDYPTYLIVTAAGNDRHNGPDPGEGYYYVDPDVGNWVWSTEPRELDGGSDGYDSISHGAISKNVLTVGAVDDVIGGYAGPDGVMMTPFSCWGPADDGRIKPDVVGNGVDLYSCYYDWQRPDRNDLYIAWSGTSMASPNVTGSLGLLSEHYRNTHPGKRDMLAATMKCLVIHTADECGPPDHPGPDYAFGWGLMNTLAAADVISLDASAPATITEDALFNTSTSEAYLTTDGTSNELRATLCWTDPPGTPPEASLNPPDKMLVNDLDLRIISHASGKTYFPWILSPAAASAPATTGNNDTDNVEQVVVYSPGVDSFSLRVTYKGMLCRNVQWFSLIVTGAAAITIDCNGNGINDSDEIAAGTSLDLNNNDILDECEIDSDLDGVPDDFDACPGYADTEDEDGDGAPDGCDTCPGFDDATDTDEDGVADGCDACPGFDDSIDEDGDGAPDMCDLCPGFDDRVDGDGDGIPYDCDVCLGYDDSLDDDEDGVPDGCDACPGFDDAVDSDGDRVPDGCDVCDGYNDRVDTNGDGEPDCITLALQEFKAKPGDEDLCPDDPDKTEPGVCGCGVPDIDSDGDGVLDCNDGCPYDRNKVEPGVCGCGVPESTNDTDGDDVIDCLDNCPDLPNPDQADSNGNGVGDACELPPVETTLGDCGSGLCAAGGATLMPSTLLGMAWMKHRRRYVTRA
ncbi:MAG: S8 family serine peptidase [Phycisphaerae bacterium]|nr:S8 family serine peptidase [Phycisphaerae bacterium]